MPDAKRKNVATRGLFSFGQGMYPYVGTEGIYGSVYMNKYLLNDFAKFNKEVLSDTQNWLEWKEKVVMDRQRRAGEPKFSINYKDF